MGARTFKFKPALGLIVLCCVVAFQNCASENMKGRGLASDYQSASAFNDDVAVSNISDLNDRETSVVKANMLHRRLAGVGLPANHTRIQQMADYIQSDNLEAAAALAINTNEFYQLTVRDFASKLSNRDETPLADLNDFVATVQGATRDNLDARSLLSGNYFYRAFSVSGVPDDLKSDIIKTNNHYKQLAEKTSDYVNKLVRVEGQQTVNENDQVRDHEDPAGLLTSRAFMEAHATGGTNRRIIEYTFKIFLCSTIDNWASALAPDDKVGRDIGRTPASDYMNKCKNCHSGMDALRPATAYYDFKTNDTNTVGYIAYKYTYLEDPDEQEEGEFVAVPADEQLVPYKFRRSANTFSGGFVVTSDEWVNYSDQNQFGWERNRMRGRGMQSLGNMVAYADRFKTCMAKRVFSEVCKRDLPIESGVIKKLANDFESSGFLLKSLFTKVSVQPECIDLRGEL